MNWVGLAEVGQLEGLESGLHVCLNVRLNVVCLPVPASVMRWDLEQIALAAVAGSLDFACVDHAAEAFVQAFSADAANAGEFVLHALVLPAERIQCSQDSRFNTEQGNPDGVLLRGGDDMLEGQVLAGLEGGVGQVIEQVIVGQCETSGPERAGDVTGHATVVAVIHDDRAGQDNSSIVESFGQGGFSH